MKLWKLYRLDAEFTSHYDENQGFVVRAETEQQAREIASKRLFGDEDPEMWLYARFSSCVEITLDGSPEIILVDYLAG